jgi:hypothetical protein
MHDPVIPRLFDLPKPLSTLTKESDSVQCHPYTLHCLKKLQSALEAFRTNLPNADHLPSNFSTNPYWIHTRANMATADMMFFAEYSIYKMTMYEHAVNAARRMVQLVQEIPVELYAHLSK